MYVQKEIQWTHTCQRHSQWCNCRKFSSLVLSSFHCEHTLMSQTPACPVEAHSQQPFCEHPTSRGSRQVRVGAFTSRASAGRERQLAAPTGAVSDEPYDFLPHFSSTPSKPPCSHTSDLVVTATTVLIRSGDTARCPFVGKRGDVTGKRLGNGTMSSEQL